MTTKTVTSIKMKWQHTKIDEKYTNFYFVLFYIFKFSLVRIREPIYSYLIRKNKNYIKIQHIFLYDNDLIDNDNI
jgi:hypothetical protein